MSFNNSNNNINSNNNFQPALYSHVAVGFVCPLAPPEGYVYNPNATWSPEWSGPASPDNVAIDEDDDPLSNYVYGGEACDPMDHPFDDGFDYWPSVRGTSIRSASAEPELSGMGHEPDASESEEEVSEEETESEDERPSRGEKRPALPPGVSAGSGNGVGEQASSAGVPLADAAQVQEEEDEDDGVEVEEVDDDDCAPVRPARREAAGQQSARVSAARAPTISSRKASGWSDAEDLACIKAMKEVCTLERYAAVASTEKRFEVVAERMKQGGFNRSASGVKSQWNRRLRAISGFEDRGEKKHSASGLTTSALGTSKGTKSGTSAVTPLAPDFRRDSKRKAAVIISDDEEEEDYAYAPAPTSSRPAKRARTTSAAPSTQEVPSTQSRAYYDLSLTNVLSGPRSSRQRPAAAAAPTASTRQKRAITIEDEEDEDDFNPSEPKPKRQKQVSTATPARRVAAPRKRPAQPATAPRMPSPSVPIPNSGKGSSSAAPSAMRKHRMSTFEPTNRYSNNDGRKLDKNNMADFQEYHNSRKYLERAVTPEAGPLNKAHWAGILKRRQNEVAAKKEAKARKEAEEAEEEDEDSIVSTASKANKSRELRRQRASTTTTTTTNNTAQQPRPRSQRQLSPIVEERENDSDGQSIIPAQGEAAAQLAADEEMARKLQAELNGGVSRSRRVRGFN
ncbi:hypothetical protein E4T42_08239 [Aureobasidium subglaciale]|nr:hypothetical protein E4T42_08239 [Aureobasidium subglaciale]